MNRRKFIKTGTLGVLLGANQAANSEVGITYKHPTPDEIEGPFYPVIAQKDKDLPVNCIIIIVFKSTSVCQERKETNSLDQKK